MPNEITFSEIIRLTQDTHDLKLLFDEVGLLAASLYGKDPQAFELTLRTNIRSTVARAMEQELLSTGADKQVYLEKLKDTLEKLPTIKLIFGFEPKTKIIQSISGWIRTQISPMLVLDWEFDGRLIGGVEIMYGGKFADYSLQALFAAKEKEFEASIRKTLGLPL